MVAKVIAIAQRTEYGRGTVVLSTSTAAPRPGRTVHTGHVGLVTDRGHVSERRHSDHYSGSHGPTVTPVAAAPRRHLNNNNNKKKIHPSGIK